MRGEIKAMQKKWTALGENWSQFDTHIRQVRSITSKKQNKINYSTRQELITKWGRKGGRKYSKRVKVMQRRTRAMR